MSSFRKLLKKHFGRRAPSRQRRAAGFVPSFESLESRQMLNAAPVANDDSYTILEDTALSAGPNAPPAGLNLVRWAENGHYYAHVPEVTSSWHGAETAAASMR